MQVRNYTLLQIYSPNLLVFFSLIDMIRVHLLCRHLLCVFKKKKLFYGKNLCTTRLVIRHTREIMCLCFFRGTPVMFVFSHCKCPQ